MGNAWVSPSISHITGKCNKTYDMGEVWKIDTHIYFSLSMGAFPPLDSHPMAYFIIWEMLGFPHQLPTLRENATKLIVWGEPGKLVLIFFPWYGCFFPIRFSSYGILHHMGNKWVSLSIFHSTGKYNKTHRMDAVFPLDSHLWYALWHGKCMCFLNNFL